MNDELNEIINHFDVSGTILANGKRNKIKVFPYRGIEVAIKSFKVPILINGIIYHYFRKSKAKRSFENATFLINNEIKTPKPIAFLENFKGPFLRESYYISEHLIPDFIFKNIFDKLSPPDLETILRGTARFSFQLHEKGIEFLDHSPGNTLIKKNLKGIFEYYLVDLNRMKFHHSMSFDMRMKNMRKLTPTKEMIQVMANEYAKLYHQPEEKVFESLWYHTSKFQNRFQRKQALKKKFLFWKK